MQQILEGSLKTLLRHLTHLTALIGLLAGLVSAQAAEWPKSDIPSDPAVRTGVLANGMRYAILHNNTPAGAVSVRFAINAGAMQEAPDQRGLAHFVEHLAFRGSAHFPDGEVNKSLQRLGLRFGSDTNASTGQDDTIYKFDLPRSDDPSVATALAISRDIAGNLDLTQAAAKTEAGVILSELKLRDTPSYRALESEMNFELVDPHATVMAGGDPAIVAAAPIARIRDYYRAYYRPERAVLVVVGDVDADKVEAQIKARFSDWQGKGPAGLDPVIHVPLDRGLDAKLYIEAGASSRLSLSWLLPLDAKPTSRAQWKSFHIQAVALSIVNRRLQQLATSPERPFQGARLARDEAENAAELVNLTIAYEPGNWRRALEAAEAVRLGLLNTGVSQGEVNRVMIEQHAARTNANLAANTRTTAALVNEILENAADDDIFTNPAEDLAASDEDLKDLKAETVNAALKQMFAGPGPLIFLSGTQDVDGGADALKAAFLDAGKAAATAPPRRPPSVADWTYSNFGTPGTIVETRNVADLDVTFVRFANGVRLSLRPSKLRANQVLVTVKVGNGRLDLPTDRVSAAWLSGALVAGGLKDLSFADMQQALVGKSWRAAFGIGEDGMVFSGATTPGDINTQMQVLAAYLRAPGYRPEAFEQLKTAALLRRKQSDALPGGVLQREAGEILHAGDKRWASPSIADMQSATVDDVRALLDPAFADGAIDIVIVGDIDTAKATQAVAATFGALPSRNQAHAAVSAANTVHFPAGRPQPIRLDAPNQQDQSIVTISWPTHGRFPDLKDDANLQLLGAIMQDRLLTELRGLGTVYVASASASASWVFDYGYLQASAQLQPDKIDKFNSVLDSIGDRLKSRGPTADELQRAKVPALQNLARSQQANDYWLSVLDGAQEDESRLDLARKYQDVLANVTAKQVQAAARKYLNHDSAIRMVVGPG